MALFVQIDHFRKTDQKPTVKNHLFSISWFRSFNRTSFQQQLKLNWIYFTRIERLQSYILSTTTETFLSPAPYGVVDASIVHPFNNNWNDFQSAYSFSSPHCFNRTSFQQQLKLSDSSVIESTIIRFNRTSFQQQLKRSLRTSKIFLDIASIVHPFNNNWNTWKLVRLPSTMTLQSYILSTTTETFPAGKAEASIRASIVHPFNNNWNTDSSALCPGRYRLQSYILSTTTETSRQAR